MSDPAVSVVIPVRNERDAIVDAVNSVLAQDYAGDVEVIIADGASIDGTPAAVEAAFGSDASVFVVDNPIGLTPAGLNAAITAAGGDVIVRCDAHATLPAGYIARAVALLDETGADVVGGRQNALGASSFGRAVAAAMASPFGAGGATYRVGTVPGPTDTVYLGVFRRSALERVGLFDESLERNQDYELNQRIRASGGTVYFHPDLSVDYIPRSSPADLWSQYWQYGAWKREVVKREPGSMRLRQAAAPALVLGLFASVLLAVIGRLRLASLLPAAYLTGLTAAAGKAAARSGIGEGGRVWLALAVMHVAWGLGFFFGTARPGSPRIPNLDQR